MLPRADGHLYEAALRAAFEALTAAGAQTANPGTGPRNQLNQHSEARHGATHSSGVRARPTWAEATETTTNTFQSLAFRDLPKGC
jgi:hypothetical protein